MPPNTTYTTNNKNAKNCTIIQTIFIIQQYKTYNKILNTIKYNNTAIKLEYTIQYNTHNTILTILQK